MSGQARHITVVAALVRDPDGRLLLVRKRGTQRYIQPGGKPDLGEEVTMTAAREVAEETGLTLDPDRFTTMGTIHTNAANEPDHTLTAHCVSVCLNYLEASHVSAAAEIEEAVWVSPQQAMSMPVAPLLHDHILPAILTPTTP